ncbi:MAG: iron chelate uptake ABC transporter family permease subunit [Candidatus Puniceispirillum sp.]
MIVLLADIAVRLTPTAGEIKLGVFTALLGTPFFLYLIKRQSG